MGKKNHGTCGWIWLDKGIAGGRRTFLILQKNCIGGRGLLLGNNRIVRLLGQKRGIQSKYPWGGANGRPCPYPVGSPKRGRLKKKNLNSAEKKQRQASRKKKPEEDLQDARTSRVNEPKCKGKANIRWKRWSKQTTRK